MSQLAPLLLLLALPSQAAPPAPAPISSSAAQAAARCGREVAPGVMLLTGTDLQPFQTRFADPELADPYATVLKDSVIVSGTAPYALRFGSLDALSRGGPYQVLRQEFLYPDGTPMPAASWDLKPVLWGGTSGTPRLWDPARDRGPPLTVWYGGRMRQGSAGTVTQWPSDNYSRDVFPFVEKEPGRWISLEESLFNERGSWPRAAGSYLGHRYGHQIAMIPKGRAQVPAVFYEEVTAVRANGLPAVTKIFMDELESPFRARGKPIELLSPLAPDTGKPYPRALREDGSALVEGPLYFRFRFEGELWEAIGFSAGSFYARYTASFASRKVRDGLKGLPYRPDLYLSSDPGGPGGPGDSRGQPDFNDAGSELGQLLKLAGGPGRPAVIVKPDGTALPGPDGRLQLLVHGYRRDILPDNDWGDTPGRYQPKYSLGEMFRVVIHASLEVRRGPGGALRFKILPGPAKRVAAACATRTTAPAGSPAGAAPAPAAKAAQARKGAPRST